jgi:hypothetical protein
MKAGTCNVSIVFAAACKLRTVLELRGSTASFQRVGKGFTLRGQSTLQFRHRIVFRMSQLADWWIVRYGVVIVNVVISGHLVVVIVHTMVSLLLSESLVSLCVYEKITAVFQKCSFFLTVDAHRSQDLAYENDRNSR